jgi:transposase
MRAFHISLHCADLDQRTQSCLVKQKGCGVHILPLRLPTKSPWLNPIEPKWVHGKRAIAEPHGLLWAKQLTERICTYFGCSSEPFLSLGEMAL